MTPHKNFVTITMMLLVVFFLFQMPGVFKENYSDADTNEYAAGEAVTLTAEEQFDPAGDASASVWYVGKEEAGGMVEQFCTYTKRTLWRVDSVEECMRQEYTPKVLLLDSACLDYDTDAARLTELAKSGVSMVFLNLPAPSVIRDNEELMHLLGVTSVLYDQIDLTGIRLFGGLLLGGDVNYIAETKKEEKKQDMELTVPWYLTLSGTKTYMVGMVEDETVKNEYLPAIIWRSSIGEAKIFAVNGDYMSDGMGIGILEGMMAELGDYELYPVVNAQTFAVAGYPCFADENDAVIQKEYSRTMYNLFRDVLWQGIASVAEQMDQKLTALLVPQYDYTDEAEPKTERLLYYAKLMREEHAEMGLSLQQSSQLPLAGKITSDTLFLSDGLPDYRYLSLYTADYGSEEYEPFFKDGCMKDVRTLLTDYNGDEPVISYTDGYTRQQAVSDAFSHTYSEDFKMRCYQTALGYSGILADMKRVAYPTDGGDTWDILSKELTTNIDTYWKPYRKFDTVTLSQSDARIRSFLRMDYEEWRKDDTITVSIENKKEEDTLFFILRTHGEEIAQVEGGSFEKLETDAYLLRADEAELLIHLQPQRERYYYDE